MDKVTLSSLAGIYCFYFHLKLPNLKTLGTHQRVGGVHFIKLKRGYFICLLHEIRHATEVEWYKGRYSDEDCYQH